MSCIKFICRQKYRFDLAGSFFSAGTFAMLLFKCRQDIGYFTGLECTRFNTALFIAAGFFAVWCVGYVFDRLKVANHLQNESNERNAMAKDIEEIKRRVAA